MHQTSASLEQFRDLVGLKFQLYNSLFTSLPFHRIEATGVLLSLFLLHCEEGFKKHQSPEEIIESFLNNNTSYRKEQEWIDLLFRFVQYSERQVVLFDALEDAAFSELHDINGAGTLKQLSGQVIQLHKEEEFTGKLKNFCVRLVLTAHPTQFYPGEVLGIINDLSSALKDDKNTATVNMYLRQLGKTPFVKKQKPTPFDEATSLLWFLENIFYSAAGKIISQLKSQFNFIDDDIQGVFRMGFWPGADRDGNPFVTTDITLKVAKTLRNGILRAYHADIRKLKRRLTFKGIEEIMELLEERLFRNLYKAETAKGISQHELIDHLSNARKILIEQHNSLFLEMLDEVISKVQVFGLYFASLDIRQESTIHGKVLAALAEKNSSLAPEYNAAGDDEKINMLFNIQQECDINVLEDELYKDTIKSAEAVEYIQQMNGEAGCHRYIISQCNSALNVVEVFGLFLCGGWKKENLTVDIVPLFETIDDLRMAKSIMQTLYSNKDYDAHLNRRNRTQTIMLGFSDGTKDGGYLMANWSIYKAKEELTAISKEFGVEVIFFDGRGGPPARGGGKTHKFYASMGSNISKKEIQLTIQGQTISSNFGTVESARFNIEQLMHAGISNALFTGPESAPFTTEMEDIMGQLSEYGYTAYSELKNHTHFVDYLSHASPLRYYAETNIGSRPAKRGGSSKLSLKDLRAIPYVGAWSQIKQNVTGYYGVGIALKKAEETGRWEDVKELYKMSLFFRTLIENCEMAMKKSFFPLTEYLSKDEKYAELWNMMHDEYNLTLKYISKLTGNEELMEDYPIDNLSVKMRERIVLPLVTIQQYALTKIRKMEEQKVTPATKAVYEKLVIRCSFGIINAGRNSA